MNRRPGVTLLEVLITIFIMGIGMLALLTLFPLGALSMAQAIRDDRLANAANMASALANAWDVRHDPNVKTALDGFRTTPPTGGAAPDPIGPGYPLIVDPFTTAYSGNLGAGAGTIGIPRSASYVPIYASTPSVNRWFSLPDEMNFNTAATPDGTSLGSGVVLQRQGRYTWAYLLRRPQSSVADPVELTVLLYYARPTSVVVAETPYSAGGYSTASGASTTNTRGLTAVALTYSAGTPPPVRQGTWLADITYETATSAATGATYGSVHSDFYRAVNVSDDGAGTMTIELDTPIKANTLNTVVVLENVAEVLYKGTGWRP